MPTHDSDVTQWAPFVGLTGLVLTAFLGLARLSQGMVGGDSSELDSTDDDRSGPIAASPPRDPADGRVGERTDERRSNADDGTAEPEAEDSAQDGAATRPDGAPAGAAERRARPAERQVRDAAGVGTDEPTVTPGMLLANVALTQGLFGALLAGGAWYFAIPADAVGIGGGLAVGPAVAVGVGFGLVLWTGNELASGLASAGGAEYDEDLRSLLAPDDTRGWVLLLGVTLPIIAAVEEFVFRAAAIGVPAAGFETSPWALAVVSSVAFALGHGAQGRVGVVVTGALGLALAAAFVLTGSLLAVVVAHYLVNALEFLVHEGLGLPDPVWG